MIKHINIFSFPGAIDEIVNQIKGGRFHLKSTEQKAAAVKKPREEPPALKEMLNILSTLRRRPKAHKEPKEAKDTTDKAKWHTAKKK